MNTLENELVLKLLDNEAITITNYYNNPIIHDLIHWVNGDYTNYDESEILDSDMLEGINNIKRFISDVRNSRLCQEFFCYKSCYRGFYHKDESRRLYSYTADKEKAIQWGLGGYLSEVQSKNYGFFDVKKFLERLFKNIDSDLHTLLVDVVSEDFFSWVTDEDEILVSPEERSKYEISVERIHNPNQKEEKIALSFGKIKLDL